MKAKKMELNEITHAKQLLEDLPNKGWTETAIPVNVEKIALDYGVTIDSNFEPRFIHKIAAVEDKRIWINSYDADEYTALRRHIVAHELGHIVLHRPSNGEALHFTDTSSSLRSSTFNLSEQQKTIEVDANWFAAELLIPLEALKKYLNETPGILSLVSDQIVKRIAEHFDVPVSLVGTRFEILGRQRR